MLANMVYFILSWVTLIPSLLWLVFGMFFSHEEKKSGIIKSYIQAQWFLRVTLLFVLLHIGLIVLTYMWVL